MHGFLSQAITTLVDYRRIATSKGTDRQTMHQTREDKVSAIHAPQARYRLCEHMEGRAARREERQSRIALQPKVSAPKSFLFGRGLWTGFLAPCRHTSDVSPDPMQTRNRRSVQVSATPPLRPFLAQPGRGPVTRSGAAWPSTRPAGERDRAP